MAINRANGSVTGVNNKTSAGGNSITRIPASTTFEVQPGTTEVDVLVVAGGGGSGGDQGAGGGGAGGLNYSINNRPSISRFNIYAFCAFYSEMSFHN